jgi:hypothetical protein
LDRVESEPGTFEGAQTLRNRLHLDRVERDERRLSSALVAHVLDAVDSRLFVVHNDGVCVASKHDHDRLVIFVCGRAAEIDDPAVNAGKDALEAGKGLLEPDLTLILSLIDARLEELLIRLVEALVNLRLFETARVSWRSGRHLLDANALGLSMVQLRLDPLALLIELFNLAANL